jgi:hypothetical protein
MLAANSLKPSRKLGIKRHILNVLKGSIMKLTAWLLCLCFTMNVFAASTLTEAVDEYNYALSVEWDQNDQAFKDTQTKIFFAKITELMDGGLTQQEVNEFVATKVSDKGFLSELSHFAKNARTVQDLMDILNTNSEHFYARGANWSGSTVLKGGVIAAVSALFIYSVYFSIKYGGCVETTGGTFTPCNASAY